MGINEYLKDNEDIINKLMNISKTVWFYHPSLFGYTKVGNFLLRVSSADNIPFIYYIKIKSKINWFKSTVLFDGRYDSICSQGVKVFRKGDWIQEFIEASIKLMDINYNENYLPIP